jgi:arginine exporter protein ArgO
MTSRSGGEQKPVPETTTPMHRREPGELVASVVAGVFLVTGVAGFIPGVTANLDEMTFAGHHSGAMLFGVFAVSVLHNAVHLAFGVIGLVMARSPKTARIFLVGGGGVYAALWLYGLAVDHESGANVLPVNPADGWLHLFLALTMFALAWLVGTPRRPTNTPMHAPN